jgi:hypothetical protein
MPGHHLYHFLRQMKKVQQAHIVQVVTKEMLAEGHPAYFVTSYRLARAQADARFGMKVAITPYQ